MDPSGKPSALLSAIVALPLERYCELQQRLVRIERDAEVDAALAALQGSDDDSSAAGSSLPRVLVSDVTTGLFGRSIVTFSDCQGRAMPSHTFTTGDIVGIRKPGGATAGGGRAGTGGVPARAEFDATGVVTKVTETSLVVAVDDKSDTVELPDAGDRVRLDKLADDVTFKRLKDTLEALEKGAFGPAARVLHLLFGNALGAADRTWPRFCSLRPPAGALGKTAQPRFDGGSDNGGSALPPLCFVPFQAAPLNASQAAAVAACLEAEDLAMIHGPPGTGKTTTVVEYIRQEVARGRRVLACAPSNVAVDNLLERLARPAGGSRPVCVRLGHPARMTAAVLAHSLDALVAADARTAIVADARAELASVVRQLQRAHSGGGGGAGAGRAARRELRAEERRLRAEIRSREELVVAAILRGADVVLTTCTGAASRVLRRALTGAPPTAVAADVLGPVPGAAAGEGATAAAASAAAASAAATVSTAYAAPGAFRGFDVAVIDEVAQGQELACLIPALQAGKLVVAGDHQQLPPTVVSDAAAAQGAAVTLADRCVALYGAGATPARPAGGPAVVHLLDTQYRMHADVCRWSSDAFYGGALRADPSVAGHRLSQLPRAAALADAAASTRVPGSTLREVHAGAKAAAEAEIKAAAAAAGGGGGGGAAEAGAQQQRRRPGGASAAAAAAPPRAIDVATARAVATQSQLADGGGDGDFWADNEALDAPVLLIDTAGCGVAEVRGAAAASASKANVGEADIVVKHVLALLAAGLDAADIAVVTPYNAQVGLLRALLGGTHPRLEVRSVDGFQGQEKEAVVISCVRSNAARAVGFLADYRRMNVAVTRARRHVAIVADTDTVRADPTLRGLVEYAERVGQVRSGAEYLAAPVTAAGGTPAGAAAAAMGLVGGGGGAAAAGAEAAAAKAAAAKKAAADERKRADIARALASLVDRVRLLQADHAHGGGSGSACSSEPLSSLRVPLFSGMRAGHAAVTCSGCGAAAAAGALSSGAAPARVLMARLELPAALTSFERMLVHEAAGALPGMTHESQNVTRDSAVGAPVGALSGSSNRSAAACDAAASPAAAEQEQASDAALRRIVVTYSCPCLVASDAADTAAAAVVVAPNVAELAMPAESLETTSLDSLPFSASNAPAHLDSATAPGAPATTAAAASAATTAPAAALAAAAAPAASPNALLKALHDKRVAAAAAAAAASSPGKTSAAATGGGRSCGDAAAVPSIVPVAPVTAAAAAAMTAGAGAGGGGGKKGRGKAAGGSATGGRVGGDAGRSGGPSARAAPLPELDDDDALLDAVLAAAGRCAARGCRKPAHAATGVTCAHCALRFCYAHGLPEEHGCGDAARAAARKDWRAAGGSAALGGTAGAGAKVNDWKHDALARQLHKKLDAAAAERAGDKGGRKGGKP